MLPTGDPNAPQAPPFQPSGAPRPEKLSVRDLNAEIAARARIAVGTLRMGELARLAGSNPETVRRYMGGQTRIPAWFVARLAECLGVPADWLLYGDSRRQVAGHPPTGVALPPDHGAPPVHSADPSPAGDAAET